MSGKNVQAALRKKDHEFHYWIEAAIHFVHQALVHADPLLYSLGHIEEALLCHPELTAKLTEAFELKFSPQKQDLNQYRKRREEYLALASSLDTGKDVLQQAMHFVDYTLKTNFYRKNKTALSFRLDPTYLDHLPYERRKKFPELPYAIFFMQGAVFIGFHIRFKDLARGGLRTVCPETPAQALAERNNVFSECYNLAYTQNKKNKDIPEGGSKGVILLEPNPHLQADGELYKRKLSLQGLDAHSIEERLKLFYKEKKLESLYQAQRSFIESFLVLLNCHKDGTLKAKDILDYWKKPEYIYLGPDENMHNEMIEWIAAFSTRCEYKPKGAFISSRVHAGINHKVYGVTSLGVNVFMEATLRFLGIDPHTHPFTVKMSGGPDGDVAGNQMLNLHRHYPHTAKLLATIDISGTLFDPKGLDLKEMVRLFQEGKPLCFYPVEKLSEGGFLLNTTVKQEHAQHTLLWRKKKGEITQEWLSENEMNHLLHTHIHKVNADIFIPAGGRPRTLGKHNYTDFLDEAGHPTAKAIIEGANLYLTPYARQALEKLGVLIIKDSSANKGGVICSSFEVLCNLILSEEEFAQEKSTLVEEILQIIRYKCQQEADLLLKTHQETSLSLTEISDLISCKINTLKDELLQHLLLQPLPSDPKDPLIRCLLAYCPPLLRTRYMERILLELPDVHKKAIIACHIASRLVYCKGLQWTSSVADLLPLSDGQIISCLY